MLLKDFIVQLQALYDSHTDDWKIKHGEPEIMVDSFRMVDQKRMLCMYQGFDENIEVVKSDDGQYNIISGFEKEATPKNDLKEVWKYL